MSSIKMGKDAVNSLGQLIFFDNTKKKNNADTDQNSEKVELLAPT